MIGIPKDQEELTEEEIAKRRDEAVERMLKTPPKPNKGEKPSANKNTGNS